MNTPLPAPPPDPLPAPSSTAVPGLAVLPVTGLGEVRAGDDLAALLAAALHGDGPCPARDGDVLCVASKLVSKAQGLVVDPSAKERAVEAATVRRVARRRHGAVVTSVVESVSGPVMAAAGIDASNAPDGLLLLPADPDAAARALCGALRELLGVEIGVILSDTCSRIWRTGVTDLALGAAGVQVLEDLRGGIDDAGRPLGVTVRALADEIAAAADLVKGKATRVPAALVRGLPAGTVAPLGGMQSPVGTVPGEPCSAPAQPSAVGARTLVRTGEGDWFRRPSLESVWQALGLAADEEPIAAMGPEPDHVRIARALAVAATRRDDDRDDEDEQDLLVALSPAGAAPTVDGPVADPAAPGPVADPAAAGPVADPAERGPVADTAAPGPAEGSAPLLVHVVPGGDDPASWMRAGARAERIRTALAAESIARPLPPVRVVVRGPAPAADRRPDPQEDA